MGLIQRLGVEQQPQQGRVHPSRSWRVQEDFGSTIDLESFFAGSPKSFTAWAKSTA